MLFNDVQTKLEGEETHSYSAYRIKLLSSDALQLGNINLVWNPSTSTETVHHLRVHRDGEVIDILQDNSFAIFQREGRLEQSMLDGLLTANLQIPGLRVGDEIEFASTLSASDPLFRQEDYGLMFLGAEAAPGTYRLRLDWSADDKPELAISEDLRPSVLEETDGISIVVRDPSAFIAPEGAPRRYGLGRLVQYSGLPGWEGLSRKFSGPFAVAAKIDGIAELDQRIDEIASTNAAPKARAEAALRLVQESVRYVFAGMDGGNYRPANSSDTWDRRFGDCKGVTALLIGILDKLGIAAEPVLVASGGGDGLDAMLPSPVWFDHVVARTRVGNKVYWLDGTRGGDDRLMTDADIPYRWVLPVSATGAKLEKIAQTAPAMPSELVFLDIDARDGVEKPARVKSTQVLRGDGAIGTMLALRRMPEATARDALKREFSGWISPETAAWSYDRESAALSIIVEGPADLEWEDLDEGANSAWMYLPQAGFNPPNKRERPVDQDQQAPWQNDSSRFACSVVRVRLPAVEGSSWQVTGKKIGMKIGGVAYYRVVNLAANTVELVRASRTMDSEISAAEAKKANDSIKEFDNSKAWVSLVPKSSVDGDYVSQVDKQLPNLDEIDWLKESAICKSG